jgi:hypothetical protein
MLASIAAYLEREAGYITTGWCCIIGGAILYHFKFPKGDDLMVFGMGLMARSMTGKGDGSMLKSEAKTETKITKAEGNPS